MKHSCSRSFTQSLSVTYVVIGECMSHLKLMHSSKGDKMNFKDCSYLKGNVRLSCVVESKNAVNTFS